MSLIFIKLKTTVKFKRLNFLEKQMSKLYSTVITQLTMFHLKGSSKF